MKKKALLFLFVPLLIVFLSSCEEDNKDEIQPVTVAEFIGKYLIGAGSFWVPLDQNGNPILTEKRSIEGDTMIVERGLGDTLLLRTPTLGKVKTLPRVDGQKVNLTIPNQSYNGFLDFTGGGGTLQTTEQFYFEKAQDGKKFFDSNSGIGKFRITMRTGTSRFEAQLRRSSRFQ